MLCYILLQTILCFFTLSQSAYLVIFWRPFNSIYNAFWLYYLGTLQIVTVVFASISVIFLGIDRCLCLQFPFKYSGLKRYIPVGLTCFFFSAAIGGAIAKGAFPAVPLESKTVCKTYGCLATNMGGSFYVLLRCVLSGSNIITGGILVKLLWKKITNFRSVVRSFL
uniref:Uncharacterized protein n=1 Tax=Panagrolaimus sp. PS1159 TaxID=55785 RepID=A0AC35FSL6_9BILA